MGSFPISGDSFREQRRQARERTSDAERKASRLVKPLVFF
jgi:hypothetical protein